MTALYKPKILGLICQRDNRMYSHDGLLTINYVAITECMYIIQLKN